MIQNREDQVTALLQYPNLALAVGQKVPHPAGSVDHDGELSEGRHKGKSADSTGLITEMALHAAAAMGYRQVVQLLLANGANIEVTRREAYSLTEGTPLDSAAHHGRIGVVRLLLEKGADIEATRSSNGSTALYNASWRGHVGVVRRLLASGADIEATTTEGEAALQAAASYLQTEALRLLLEKGANVHATNKKGETVLHSVFEVAIADPKLKDSKQLIPTITVLLAHGANILQKDNFGNTPLDLAEQGRHLEAKKLFLRHINFQGTQLQTTT